MENAAQRLQELESQLPQMEEIDQQLSRAIEAATLIHKKESLQGAKIEFSRASKKLSEAQKHLAEAQKTGTKDQIEAAGQQVSFWGNQCGYHSAPARFGKKIFDQLLQESSFESEEEAQQAFLPAQRRTALQKQIDDYKEEYFQALNEVKETV